MRHVESGTGARMPVVGLGTWDMGVRRTERTREVAALQLGFDLGLTLVDTAEMYAQGGAEEVVGEALQGRREGIFVVSKVLPENASCAGTQRAAERSLQRLRIDCIDLYLLHWPGDHPLEETFEAFAALQSAGKICHYGVSNFDLAAVVAVAALPQGAGMAANQVYYNLVRRGIERRLLPWCLERGVVVMAYSPLEQGRLPDRAALREVAARHRSTPAQVALAWSIRQPGVVAIPKAADARHVRDNARAASIVLAPEDVASLETDFPAPGADIPLETL